MFKLRFGMSTGTFLHVDGPGMDGFGMSTGHLCMLYSVLLYYYCTTTVLLLYYCTTAVLKLYYSTTTGLLLY